MHVFLRPGDACAADRVEEGSQSTLVDQSFRRVRDELGLDSGFDQGSLNEYFVSPCSGITSLFL